MAKFALSTAIRAGWAFGVIHRRERFSLFPPLHGRFVQGIVAGGTAKAAYIAAGYSDNGAAQSAQRLLKNPEIQCGKAELEKKVVVTFIAGQIAERQYRLTVLGSC